jgi:hypothetical protein
MKESHNLEQNDRARALERNEATMAIYTKIAARAATKTPGPGLQLGHCWIAFVKFEPTGGVLLLDGELDGPKYVRSNHFGEQWLILPTAENFIQHAKGDGNANDFHLLALVKQKGDKKLEKEDQKD